MIKLFVIWLAFLSVLLCFSDLYAYINYTPEDKSIGAFADKVKCETISGKKCLPFDPAKINPETSLAKDVEVDDPEKPIFAARTNETDCIQCNELPCPEDSCSVLSQRKNIGTEEDPEYIYPLCDDPTYFTVWAKKSDFGLGEGYFVYCTKHLGYEKKTVKKLVEDAQLKAQWEAAKQAKEQEMVNLKNSLKDCKIKLESNPTAKDMQDCLKLILNKMGVK